MSRKKQSGNGNGGAGRSVEEFKTRHNPDADIVWLRQRVAELEAQRDQEKLKTGEALEIVHDLRDAIVQARPQRMAYLPPKAPGKSSPCTMVLHLSDWHYGAVTRAEEVDDFGEYSPEIAESRVRFLGERIIDKVAAQRKGYHVPTLQIVGTADYISGDIHPELQVTNAFPCPVQSVRCGYLMGELFEMLASHFEEVLVDLITLDNHGRLTRKPQAAQGGLNNWGFVTAEIAAQYCRNLKNVKVNIHAKPSALVTVGPERYLAFHGHQIRAWMNKPYYGFDRRVAMEAVKRMNIPAKSFTKLLLGHFHVSFDGDYWKTGGALSGTDAHDHDVGRFSPPNQTSWFVHPLHGEFDWTRWWLQK